MSKSAWHRDPDVWAVIIVASAFAISVITWLDVSRQLKLYRGQVRAYVQIVDARLVESISDASFLKLELHLKNAGQTAATNIIGEMDYRHGSPGRGDAGNSATRKPVAPMGPGLERVVVLSSNKMNRGNWPAPFPPDADLLLRHGMVSRRHDGRAKKGGLLLRIAIEGFYGVRRNDN
jgi:hypothetical protein